MSNIFGFENLVAYQLSIANRRHYISDEAFQGLASDIENIARPLSGLRNSLNPQP